MLILPDGGRPIKGQYLRRNLSWRANSSGLLSHTLRLPRRYPLPLEFGYALARTTGLLGLSRHNLNLCLRPLSPQAASIQSSHGTHGYVSVALINDGSISRSAVVRPPLAAHCVPPGLQCWDRQLRRCSQQEEGRQAQVGRHGHACACMSPALQQREW